jgi:selenide,water dikinase
MAFASNVRLEINTATVRFLDGAFECIEMGCVPAGLGANREFAECVVEDAARANIPEKVRAALFDPQTAGGLLIAVAPDKASALVAALQRAEYPAAEIGRAVEGAPRIVLC